MNIKPPIAKIGNTGILAMKPESEGFPLLPVLIAGAVIIILIFIFRNGENQSS